MKTTAAGILFLLFIAQDPRASLELILRKTLLLRRFLKHRPRFPDSLSHLQSFHLLSFLLLSFHRLMFQPHS